MTAAISSTYTSFSRWFGSESTQTRGSDNPGDVVSSASSNSSSISNAVPSDSEGLDLRREQRVAGSSASAQVQLDTQLDGQEQQIVQELSARDREVRTHEQAHQNAGGSLTGAASYTYEKGPDGQLYAVGGGVSVQMPGKSGDPQRDMAMARQVAGAALAPAEPSAQDRRVAQMALQMVAEAQAELSSLDGQESENPLVAARSPDLTGETDSSSPVLAPDQAAAPGLVATADGSADEVSAANLPVDEYRAGGVSERNDELVNRIGEYFDTLQQQGETRSQRLEDYQASREELSQRLREFNQKLVDMGVLDPDYFIGGVINDQA